MCGWAFSSRPRPRRAARSTILAKPAVVRGAPPLSLMKDVGRQFALPLETSQRSQLIALQGMRVGRPVLDPADVEHRTVEVHLIPSQVAQLGGTQSVPEGHEDRGRVAMPVPTFLCSLDHGVDLGGSEVFATATLPIPPPPCPTSSIYFVLPC